MSARVNIRDASVYAAFGEVVRERFPVMASEILSAAIAECPVGKTGELAASHTGPDFFWAPIRPSFNIGNSAPYAFFVHEGTAPHRITATHAPYLHFFWENRGVVFRGRSVNHPGFGGQPWLRNALFGVLGGRGGKVRFAR